MKVKFALTISVIAAVWGLEMSPALAATYYYDNNSSAAGFGAAGGAWAAPTPGPTPGWTLDGTGATTPASVTTAIGDTLNFGNGATSLGAGTITVSGLVNAGDMTFASGAGAIVLSGGSLYLAPAVTLTLNNAADTISSALDGAVTNLTKQGTGTLTLSYNANPFTGSTLISAGKVKLGAQYALWKSPYDTTGSTGAIGLDATGQGLPVLGGLAGSVDLATAVTGYGTVTNLTLNPQAGTSVAYSGLIANGAANMTLTKTGPGTQTLSGANTYSGGTTLYGGRFALGGAAGAIASTNVTVRGATLTLDDSTAWADRIPDAAALSLGSLTLTAQGGAGTNVEAFGATTFNTSGKVTLNNGGSGDQTTLALGPVTRSAGAAIDFVGTGNGTLGGGIGSPNVTSPGAFPGMTNGILPWASVGGTQWAVNNAGSIQAYAGTFVDPTTATNDSKANAQLTGTGSVASNRAFNSLNVIASGAGQGLTLGASLNLASGGLLKSGADAYTLSSSGGVLGAGATGSGTELIAHVDGGDLTISAPLNAAIVGLAKGGSGKLVLSGTRAGTFSNPISIAGTLEFQGPGAILAGAVSGPGGLTVNLNPGQKLNLRGANTYSGPTVVKGGILEVGSGYDMTSVFPGIPGSTIASAGQGLLSNVELNGGILAVRYYMSEFLGAGPGQFQITGGTSGIANYQGDAANSIWTINADANYEVVWGSTYFKPDVLALSDSTMTANGSFTFTQIPNRFDLNGATRTIIVASNPNATPYAANTHLGGVLSGVIRDSSGGPAGLIKTGIGILELRGANTFTGPITVNGGVLLVTSIANGGVANPLGQSASAAASLLLANGTTLKYTGATAATDRSFTLNGTANGDGAALDASGSGAIRFTNTACPAYGVADQARTLTLTGAYAGTNTLAANLANNGAGALSVTKTGSGTWVLSGANTYTGTNTLGGGLLSVSATNHLGAPSANLVFNGGGLQITGTTLTSLSGLGHAVSFTPGVTATFDIAHTGNTFFIDQAVNLGGGSLVKSGAGTLVFNQANGYSGQTSISGGILQYDDGAAIPTTPLLNNGALVVNRSDTVTQGVSFHSVMGGTGIVTMAGAGTLALNNVNIHSGATRANAGAIALSHPQALMNSPLDTTGTGAFTLSGVTAPTFGGLSGASGDLGSATVFGGGYSSVTNLILNPSGTVTYGGVIANGAPGMALTLAGTGTQVLTNGNSYTGATILQAGTLSLGGNGSILNSGLTLSGGGLLLSYADSDAEMAFNRVDDSAAVTANGGTLTYTTTTAGSARNFAETVGPVALASGSLNLVETLNKTAGSQTLTLAGLTRPGGANAATVAFLATGTGPQAPGNRNMMVVAGAGTTPGGQIAGPWATVGTNAPLQTDYAVYNADYVVPAAIAASAETSWSGASSAYTLSGGAALTGTRTIAALRATGAAQTLNLGTNTLETYGVLNGGTGALTVTNAVGGALTTPAGGGNLYLTSGNNAIAVTVPITDNGGAVTVVKSGSGGTLTLSSTASAYSGGTVINAGTLSITADASLGATNGGVTVNGAATLLVPSGLTLNSARTVRLNNGALVSFAGQSGDYSITIPGKVTGTGGIYLSGGSYNVVTLSHTGNDFTGPITVGFSGNNQAALTVASLGDSPSPIKFGNMTGNNTAPLKNSITFAGAAAPLIFSNRWFELTGAGVTANANIVNNNSVSNTLTINTDLRVTTTGDKLLYLQGGNTGSNTFAGRIADGPGAVVNLAKADAGAWTLSGTNAYSGTTTITGGLLEIGGAGQLGNGAYAAAIANSATLRYNSTANQTLGGVISGTGALVKRNTGDLTLAGRNTYSGATTINAGVVWGVTGGACSNSAVTVTNTPGSVAALGVVVTNRTMPWSCASLTFRTNGVGAQLRFNFAVTPSSTVAPLTVTSNLTFSGTPGVVVTMDRVVGGTYPLLVVGGTAPTALPALSGVSGSLAWGEPGNKTLWVTVVPVGSLLMVY